jgi:glycogen(starch) synthase
MRILMLGWELPPHNSGGLGIACYQLCKALSKKGADIEFVLPYTASHPGIKFMRVSAAHPQDVQSVMKSAMPYDSFKYVQKNGEIRYTDTFGQASIYEEAVSRIVKLGQFDIIHAHDWLTCRAALRAKMVTGKPLIVHMHSIESDRAGKEFGGNPMVREIEALTLSIADRVIAVSQLTKDSIVREYGIPAGKIEVVHNHFDPDNLMSGNTGNVYRYLSYMKSLGYRVVINVGRHTIQKGLPNLLHAFKEVVAREPKTFLLLVGDGEQKFELVHLAAELGIGDHVFFTGFQRGKPWRDAYDISDLFVMPSVSEPFGLVALEAIGYGTPVLISKQSGVSEVIRNCLKVDFWDINDMANKITAVVQNDALRDELHANSHREYLNRSWDQSADRLWSVYVRHARRKGVEV